MEAQTLHFQTTQPHMTRPHLLSKLFQSLKPFSTSALSFPKESLTTRASKLATQQLKENWLESLTCPLPNSAFSGGLGMKGPDLTRNGNVGSCGEGGWVIGIDPDVSGAFALLKTDDGSNYSAQVFDSPHLKVMVGKRARKRLDAKSIVQLLRSFNAPSGTTAYIEQSIPYPKDGKFGWWSGGFSYGLWIGILVASGFSVVPIPSFTWKNEFQLSGGGATKDDSRRIALALFPSLSSSLQRKKDHGRAEALLIAAYGKDLKKKSPSPFMVEELS